MYIYISIYTYTHRHIYVCIHTHIDCTDICIYMIYVASNYHIPNGSNSWTRLSTVDTKQRQALKGLERSPRSPGLLPRFRAIHQVTAANSYGKIWQNQKKKQVLDESWVVKPPVSKSQKRYQSWDGQRSKREIQKCWMVGCSSPVHIVSKTIRRTCKRFFELTLWSGS